MKRSELYAKVWATPVTKLSAELGISGTRLAVICKRHGIPTPPRGYWTRLASGKQPPRIPLSDPEVDYEVRAGAAEPKKRSMAWLVPGVLQRSTDSKGAIGELGAETSSHHNEAGANASGSPVGSASPDTPTTPATQLPTSAEVLDLVRAAAQEFERRRAIETLFEEMLRRTLIGKRAVNPS